MAPNPVFYFQHCKFSTFFQHLFQKPLEIGCFLKIDMLKKLPHIRYFDMQKLLPHNIILKYIK